MPAMLVMPSGLMFRFSESYAIMLTFGFVGGEMRQIAGVWDGIYGGFSGWMGVWDGIYDGTGRVAVYQDSCRRNWWFGVDRILDLKLAISRTFHNHRGQLVDEVDPWHIVNLSISDGHTPQSTLGSDVEIVDQ